jgi:hypothetical protein
MIKITTSEIMKLQDEGTCNLYVRWSRGPRYDTKASRDYANGGHHVGLSAVWIDYWERDVLERRLREYEFLRIKDSKIKAYIYQADEIGRDSDNAPSITVGSKCLGEWTGN